MPTSFSMFISVPKGSQSRRVKIPNAKAPVASRGIPRFANLFE
ncbi:hypothetical protein ACVJBD_007560 [Rhizobium mongolense]